MESLPDSRSIELRAESVCPLRVQQCRYLVRAFSSDPYGESELERAGLTPISSDIVSPPRVKEAPVHFECRLLSLTQVGKAEAGASTVVIGEVVKCHIHSRAWNNGKVLLNEIKPVARLGGLSYSTVESYFDLERGRL